MSIKEVVLISKFRSRALPQYSVPRCSWPCDQLKFFQNEQILVDSSATFPLDNIFHLSLKYDSVKIFKLSLPFLGSIKVQGGQDFLLECEDLDLPEQIEKIL